MLGLKWHVKSDTLQITNGKKFPQELDHWYPSKGNFFFSAHLYFWFVRPCRPNHCTWQVIPLISVEEKGKLG